MKKNIGQYSQLSIDITEKLTKNEKKEYGIFISPKTIIDKLFETIQKYVTEHNLQIKTILEPSCGTCEIVNCADNNFQNITIDAIEFNITMYHAIKELTFKNKVNIIHQDYIQFVPQNNYDLIVGNPPYFVLDKKYQPPKQYSDHIHGRPNIFGLFILHAITMVNINGIIGFIIPKSFLNSAYYSKIRNYIKQTCKIIEIIDFEKDNKFIDTQQATFGIILQKHSNSTNKIEECNYSIQIGNDFMFTNDSAVLKNIFKDSTTLSKLGLSVRTGQIVWNQHKDELTENEEDTVLVYNTNLTKEHKIDLKKFKNEEKKQYISKDGRIDTILVVNRGNGNSKYKLEYSLIDFGPYLIENHLNEIYSNKKMKKDKLIELFNVVMKSFENPKTQQFIDIFLGNNGLSKTELETIFPIYLT
jgi:hypothetical protein